MVKIDVPELVKKDSQMYREVEDYFSKNIHGGYIKPFSLVGLAFSDFTLSGVPVVHAIPRNVDREDIDFPDNNWNKGLMEIGSRYGVYIGLSPELYER